jgi:hypothetical protein
MTENGMFRSRHKSFMWRQVNESPKTESVAGGYRDCGSTHLGLRSWTAKTVAAVLNDHAKVRGGKPADNIWLSPPLEKRIIVVKSSQHRGRLRLTATYAEADFQRSQCECQREGDEHSPGNPESSAA